MVYFWWVKYADVTAKDFVTSLKHAADSKSDGLYIVQKSIKAWMIMSMVK